MTPDTLSKLKSIVGPKGFTEDPAEIAPHLEEWRSKYKGRASLLLKPATTAEVAAVLELCNQTSTAVVPQGGNTGLVGAQIPFDGEVLISLSRMNRIRAIRRADASMIAEGGVILAAAQNGRRRKRSAASDQPGVGRQLHDRRHIYRRTPAA